MMYKNRNRMRTSFLVLIVIIAIGLNFFQLPYYITKPGSAENVDEMVHVKGNKEEPGHFMLTTILVGKANIYQYLLAKVRKYSEILPVTSIEQPDESNDEYNLRQLNYMDEAQKTATYVAYKYAKKNPKIDYHGVLVLNVISSMPASKSIKAGDVIVAADGKQVKEIKDVQAAVKGKEPGDKITLTVSRDGKEKKLAVEIGTFPKEYTSSDVSKAGIGIVQSPDFDIKVSPEVDFDTGSIGGPSAGLMMTLEIYEELTKQNMRHDNKIAGTGTIAMDGTVGPIGGISQKIVAADRAGADYFFAPVAQNEAADAQKTAKDIGTDMKVIPVRTFQDALDFLNTLKD